MYCIALLLLLMLLRRRRQQIQKEQIKFVVRSTIGHKQRKFSRNHELTNKPTIQVTQSVNTEYIAQYKCTDTHIHWTYVKHKHKMCPKMIVTILYICFYVRSLTEQNLTTNLCGIQTKMANDDQNTFKCIKLNIKMLSQYHHILCVCACVHITLGTS